MISMILNNDFIYQNNIQALRKKIMKQSKTEIIILAQTKKHDQSKNNKLSLIL